MKFIAGIFNLFCALIDYELIVCSEPLYSYLFKSLYVFLKLFFFFLFIYFLLMTKGGVVDSI